MTRRPAKRKNGGFTLVELIVAASLLAITTVVTTQAMLILNRNSAIARVRNLAKAVVLSRVQEAAAVKFDPFADTPVIPAPLVVTLVTPAPVTVNIGDASTGLGAIPGSLYWIVSKDSLEIRTIRCRVEYTYLGRLRNYETLTFRSPD